MKIHFRPKTEQAENDQIANFRRRKQKRVSVGFKFDGLTWVTLIPSDFTTDLRHVKLMIIIVMIKINWMKIGLMVYLVMCVRCHEKCCFKSIAVLVAVFPGHPVLWALR